VIEVIAWQDGLESPHKPHVLGRALLQLIRECGAAFLELRHVVRELVELTEVHLQLLMQRVLVGGPDGRRLVPAPASSEALEAEPLRHARRRGATDSD
jgi:hypothetical protein